MGVSSGCTGGWSGRGRQMKPDSRGTTAPALLQSPRPPPPWTPPPALTPAQPPPLPSLTFILR